MKKLFALLTALVVVVALAACGKKSTTAAGTTTKENGTVVSSITSKQTITVWNTYTAHQQEAFQEMVDAFNASQDMITVDYQPQAYAEFDSNLMNAARTGKGPNIAPRYCSSAAQYKDEGLLVNLSNYINDPNVGIPNFKENLVGKEYEEIAQWGEDQIYVFPIIITSEVLYVNKTILDELGLEIPKTWTQLAEASKKIKDEKGITGWGSDSQTDTMIDMLAQQNGGYIDAATATCNVNEAKFKNVLTWYVDGLKNGYFRTPGADNYLSGPFTRGEVAMYIGSSAGAGFVLPYVNFECVVTNIPQEGDATFAPAWGGGLVAFDKHDDQQNLASYLFLKYLLSDEVIAKWAIEFGAAPSTKTAVATELFQAHASTDPVAKALMDTTQYINWVPSVAGADGVRNAFGNAVDSCNADSSNKTVEELVNAATTTFFEEANEALEN